MRREGQRSDGADRSIADTVKGAAAGVGLLLYVCDHLFLYF
jgi:hypothetical protein